jgi:cytochrome c553
MVDTMVLSRRRFLHLQAFAAIPAICAYLSLGFEGASAQTNRPPTIVTVCAPCHGIDGTGGDVEKPNLAGQKSIYIRQQLMAFRTGKRKHPEMKTIVRNLTEREINQLVIYYSTLVPR